MLELHAKIAKGRSLKFIDIFIYKKKSQPRGCFSPWIVHGFVAWSFGKGWRHFIKEISNRTEQYSKHIVAVVRMIIFSSMFCEYDYYGDCIKFEVLNFWCFGYSCIEGLFLWCLQHLWCTIFEILKRSYIHNGGPGEIFFLADSVVSRYLHYHGPRGIGQRCEGTNAGRSKTGGCNLYSAAGTVSFPSCATTSSSANFGANSSNVHHQAPRWLVWTPFPSRICLQ